MNNSTTSFKQFVRDNGYKYGTETELLTAYDICWKASHDILISENEFVFEVGTHYDTETLKEVYAVLSNLVSSNKLKNSEIYGYAHFKWCLRNPAAIIAYQTARNEWKVNNCGAKEPEAEAVILVNSEWGFEASRIRIVGTPFHDATDYQFIRFDCAHMTWLWQNGNLYQVYS